MTLHGSLAQREKNATFGAGGLDVHPLATPLLPCYSAPLSLIVTCAQCREQVLESDLIDDEEECAARHFARSRTWRGATSPRP